MTTSRHDDLSLRYVLSVPSGAPDSAELPLAIIIHGRGADANDLADLAPSLDVPGGCRFVFPNAPRPFEPMPGMQFGYSWFDGWPPEGDSIDTSRELLMQFIGELLQRYPTPKGKLILGGFSQGALMSFDVGFRTTETLAGIIAMSGAIYETDLPDLRALSNRNILIVHGQFDDVIPVIAARRARSLLEAAGLSPEYHEFPMGHFVTPESIAAVRDFVVRALGD